MRLLPNKGVRGRLSDLEKKKCGCQVAAVFLDHSAKLGRFQDRGWGLQDGSGPEEMSQMGQFVGKQ